MKLSELLGDAYKEGMTPEEIAAALESIEAPEPQPQDNYEVDKVKAALSKANSEAAAYKRQLQARMTEDERRQAELAAKEAEIQETLTNLRKEKTISETRLQFRNLGYDEQLAEETATAMAEGDFTKMFASQKKHMEAVAKKIRAEVLQGTPRPVGGGSQPKELTKEQFSKMGYSDRLKLYNENQDLYNELKGNGVE